MQRQQTDCRQLLTEYLKPWGDTAGMEPPPDNIIINGRHVSNCSTNRDKTLNCAAGSLFKARVQTGNQVRLRLISNSASTPLYFSLDNHTLSIVEIDGTEIEPIATTRVFLNPGQRYSVLISANQTVGNYKMRVAAARSCFHLGHMGEGAPSLASVNYQAVGILSYDDVDDELKPIGNPWDLSAKSNTISGKEPWDSACRDLPFDLPQPKTKKMATGVGDGNYHSFTFSREDINGTVRSYINDVSDLEGFCIRAHTMLTTHTDLF